MADFSSFSDSDDERAVEEILSQAMDSCVLEQVAAVNCASFDRESVLPTHIEARFRKLKSFPAPSSSSMRDSASSVPSLKLPSTKSMERSTPKPKQEDECVSSPSNSSNSSVAKENSSPMKETLSSGKRVLKSKAKSRSSISPSDSSNRSESYSSPSPPKKTGCFWCTPKKDSTKKSKERGRRTIPAFVSEWVSDDDEELFSDLNMFSKKERERVLKKAMKEEEKVSREAEKIVKWAKQVSGRR